ncbi:MAG: FecR domain-containing protein [Burkholderiaceae bacterium]|nr:FecR domain-containing protein [Burkholderiaceae bacterium]
MFGRLGDDYPGMQVAPPLPIAPGFSLPRSRTVLSRRRFLANTLGLATVAGVGLVIADSRYPLHNFFSDMASATGQRRQFELADGSRLLLDARSRVNVEFTPTRRDIQLLSGALSVQVAGDRERPFMVHTRQGTVRARGTQFMVRQDAGRSLVGVQEHEVRVKTRHGVTRAVAAGHGVRFDAGQVDSPRPELLDDAAWQSGVIEAKGRPLMHVISALRPYYDGVLRVSTAAGGLNVQGRFALDHVEASLQALAKQLPITVRRVTPWMTFVDVTAA